MAIRKFVVSVPITDGAGGGIAYSPDINGQIISIRYVKTDYDDGSTFTITNETTGEGIWTETAVNASATRYPRAATASTAGVAALYAAGGTAVQGRIALDSDRVKIAVTDGGADAKVGAFHITVDG